MPQDLPALDDRLLPARRALARHPLYAALDGEAALRTFMEFHVFCVWDFMSLLSALRRELSCTEVPWTPTRDPHARRWINEIALDEESDLSSDGRPLSHFELYLESMRACGADTAPVERLLAALARHAGWESALASADAPAAVADFVSQTLRVASRGPLHQVAAVFAFGREIIIPDMFRAIVARLTERHPTRWSSFLYYLQRHIDLDGGAHASAARDLVAGLCGADAQRWEDSARAAEAALRARHRLWDAVLAHVQQRERLAEARA